MEGAIRTVRIIQPSTELYQAFLQDDKAKIRWIIRTYHIQLYDKIFIKEENGNVRYHGSIVYLTIDKGLKYIDIIKELAMNCDTKKNITEMSIEALTYCISKREYEIIFYFLQNVKEYNRLNTYRWAIVEDILKTCVENGYPEYIKYMSDGWIHYNYCKDGILCKAIMNKMPLSIIRYIIKHGTYIVFGTSDNTLYTVLEVCSDALLPEYFIYLMKTRYQYLQKEPKEKTLQKILQCTIRNENLFLTKYLIKTYNININGSIDIDSNDINMIMYISKTTIGQGEAHYTYKKKYLWKLYLYKEKYDFKICDTVLYGYTLSNEKEDFVCIMYLLKKCCLNRKTDYSLNLLYRCMQKNMPSIMRYYLKNGILSGGVKSKIVKPQADDDKDNFQWRAERDHLQWRAERDQITCMFLLLQYRKTHPSPVTVKSLNYMIIIPYLQKLLASMNYLYILYIIKSCRSIMTMTPQDKQKLLDIALQAPKETMNDWAITRLIEKRFIYERRYYDEEIYTSCVICYNDCDNIMTFWRCGHSGYCEECYKVLDICPRCRCKKEK